MTPQFLKAFSAYPVSPMSVTDYARGILHPRLEVISMMAVVKPVGKSSAAAFAIADSDLDTIIAAIVSGVRESHMNLANNVNCVPDVIRDIAVYGLGEDAYQAFIACRNGSLVPAVGGAAITFPIPITVPRACVQKEYVNQNAYSGGQLYSGARVDIDIVGTALPFNVVLINGTLNITAITMELWAQTGAIRPVLWMAPAQRMFVRAATTITVESEGGPLYDEFVFGLLDTATFPNANGPIQITIDGKVYLYQTPTANLAAGYSMTVKNGETGVPTYDVSQNTKARAAAARVGRTPLIFLPGLEAPQESEIPVASGSRSINFSPQCTAAPQLAFWRQTPITSPENIQFLATMLSDPQLQPYFSELPLSSAQIDAIKNLPFDALAIQGGGNGGPGSRNDSLALFKARQFAPRAA